MKDDIKKGEEQIIKDLSSSFTVKSIFSDILELKENAGTFTLIKKKEADLSSLSQYEIDLLKDIVDEFKNTTSKALVEKTHQEPPYMQTSSMDVIDYKLAFYLDRSQILPRRTYKFNPEVSQAEYFSS